jgi:hypothetical protein
MGFAALVFGVPRTVSTAYIGGVVEEGLEYRLKYGW